MLTLAFGCVRIRRPRRQNLHPPPTVFKENTRPIIAPSAAAVNRNRCEFREIVDQFGERFECAQVMVGRAETFRPAMHLQRES